SGESMEDRRASSSSTAIVPASSVYGASEEECDMSDMDGSPKLGQPGVLRRYSDAPYSDVDTLAASSDCSLFCSVELEDDLISVGLTPKAKDLVIVGRHPNDSAHDKQELGLEVLAEAQAESEVVEAEAEAQAEAESDV
ncbi:unnamed protein product, partial [Polarella glacialis]